MYVGQIEAVAGERLERVQGTFDFLLRQAIHAVLTHLLFAEAAEAGESLSLVWDLELDALGRESAASGMPLVSEGSRSVSILGSPSISISSEMRAAVAQAQPTLDARASVGISRNRATVVN